MKKLLSFIACATIATSIATEAKAAEVTVKEGDTLWSISKDYDVSTEDIKTWNDLNSDIIKVNDTLDLQVEKTHKVKKGDTLSFETEWGTYTYSVTDASALETAPSASDNELVLASDLGGAFSFQNGKMLYVTARLVSGPSAKEVP